MPSFVYIDVGGSAAVTITKTDSGNSNGGTYSFGAADATRFIVAAISNTAAAGRTITGVTIDGVAATLVVSGNVGGAGSGDWAALYIAAVPTGTSGVVSVAFSGGITAFALTVYSIINASSAVSPSSGTATNSVNVTVPNNGVVVGVTTNISAAGPTITWSAGITKDTEIALGGGGDSSAASQNYVVGQALTVTASPSATIGQTLAVATFA